MVLSNVEGDESPNPTKQMEISKIFLVDRIANFAMDDECDKSRMKEVANESASLISSLHLGSEEMLIEEHVQLVGE